jgi:hypothetical protein
MLRDHCLCACEFPGDFHSGVPGILAAMERGRLAPGAVVERCDQKEHSQCTSSRIVSTFIWTSCSISFRVIAARRMAAASTFSITWRRTMRKDDERTAPLLCSGGFR